MARFTQFTPDVNNALRTARRPPRPPQPTVVDDLRLAIEIAELAIDLGERGQVPPKTTETLRRQLRALKK